jgi:hypothetical protein
VVVLDLATAAEESLALIAQSGHSKFELPKIVLASGEQAELEWVIRDLGAVAFLAEPVSGDDLAALCRKQWQTASSKTGSGQTR